MYFCCLFFKRLCVIACGLSSGAGRTYFRPHSKEGKGETGKCHCRSIYDHMNIDSDISIEMIEIIETANETCMHRAIVGRTSLVAE